jgi:signal transduction histidine kinase
VFDPFVRLDGDAESNPASRSGRGLGLAFCKVAIEAHGGSIRVEDASPGALFVVSLPST